MRIIKILGIVVVIIPFLGVPSSWKAIAFVVLGVVIVAKAFSIEKINQKGKRIEAVVGSTFKQSESSPIERNEEFTVTVAEETEDEFEEETKHGDI